MSPGHRVSERQHATQARRSQAAPRELALLHGSAGCPARSEHYPGRLSHVPCPHSAARGHLFWTSLTNSYGYSTPLVTDCRSACPRECAAQPDHQVTDWGSGCRWPRSRTWRFSGSRRLPGEVRALLLRSGRAPPSRRASRPCPGDVVLRSGHWEHTHPAGSGTGPRNSAFLVFLLSDFVARGVLGTATG